MNSFPDETNPTEAPQPEKRRHLRIPLRVIRVESKLRGEVFFGHATNLSKTGLYIQTTNPKPMGYELKIRFELPEGKGKVEATVEVVWKEEFTGRKGSEPGMGLKFVELSTESEELIHQFVDEKTGGRLIA